MMGIFCQFRAIRIENIVLLLFSTLKSVGWIVRYNFFVFWFVLKQHDSNHHAESYFGQFFMLKINSGIKIIIYKTGRAAKHARSISIVPAVSNYLRYIDPSHYAEIMYIRLVSSSIDACDTISRWTSVRCCATLLPTLYSLLNSSVLLTTQWSSSKSSIGKFTGIQKAHWPLAVRIYHRFPTMTGRGRSTKRTISLLLAFLAGRGAHRFTFLYRGTSVRA